MEDIKMYIKGVLRHSKLNKIEKIDLENELEDHLNNIKKEYIKKGDSEKLAVQHTIEDFNKSDFLKEINGFSRESKLFGINIYYIFKSIITSIFLYLILMSANVSILNNNIYSDLSYFFIISFILFINLYYLIQKFALKDDIILNITIISVIFFVIEKFIISLISYIYKILDANNSIDIFSLYIFDYKKIIIYIGISTIIILLLKYYKFTFLNRTIKISNTNIPIILISLILNVIYFLYPNKLYILNLVIFKLFKLNVEFFDKNLFYMIINDNFIIINVGLILIIGYIFYKISFYIVKERKKVK